MSKNEENTLKDGLDAKRMQKEMLNPVFVVVFYRGSISMTDPDPDTYQIHGSKDPTHRGGGSVNIGAKHTSIGRMEHVGSKFL